MKVTYRTWRAYRDVDDQGNSNATFKSIINGLMTYINQLKSNQIDKNNRVIPPSYQSFNIPESVFYDFTQNTQIDYWGVIYSIILACDYANSNGDNYSDLWDIDVYLKADKAFLDEEVIPGVQQRTIIDDTQSSTMGATPSFDENGNLIENTTSTTLTWGEWFNDNNGVNTGLYEYKDENDVDKVLLITNKNKHKRNRSEIKKLYEYSVSNDNTNSLELLSKSEFISHLNNPSYFSVE